MWPTTNLGKIENHKINENSKGQTSFKENDAEKENKGLVSMNENEI